MHPAAEAPQAAAHSFLSAPLLRSEDCSRKHPIPKLLANALSPFILSTSLLALEICPQRMTKNLLMNLKNWHETSMVYGHGGGRLMVGL